MWEQEPEKQPVAGDLNSVNWCIIIIFLCFWFMTGLFSVSSFPCLYAIVQLL